MGLTIQIRVRVHIYYILGGTEYLLKSIAPTIFFLLSNEKWLSSQPSNEKVTKLQITLSKFGQSLIQLSKF